jgi:hypothetical protein
MRPVSRRLAMLIAAASVMTAGVTYAAFTAVTTNAGNSVSSGTVAIADDDGGSAMLAFSGATPGSSDTSCIRVTYTGSLSSTVRLFGTVTGALAPYINLTITRGTDSAPSFDSCAGFTPDATNYLGAGPGVIWTGLVSAFPTTYAAGVVDPSPGSPESWTTSEARSYKFAVSPVDNDAGEGLSATLGVTWEARNE